MQGALPNSIGRPKTPPFFIMLSENVRTSIDALSDQGLSVLDRHLEGLSDEEYVNDVLWFQNWIEQLSDGELEVFGAVFDTDPYSVDWKREGF